jgi:hypothetical protein
MGISAKYCVSAVAAPPWPTTQEALVWLQHEMERRFAETLFGPENLAAEAESALPIWSPVVPDATMTALWELRMRFGPRGSPPRPLEEMPADVRVGLLSMFGASPDVDPEARGARFPGSAAERSLATGADMSSGPSRRG